VAELITYIRDLFRQDAVLSDIWVSGEIVDVSRSAAGHWYFTLRDADARVGVVLFRSAAARQSPQLAAGRQALVHGTVEIYEQRSVYQLVADVVLPGDAGQIKAQFEMLRTKLEKEGLFALERKRSLPTFPRRVGVATSDSGAAIQDMLRVWERRFPLLEVVLAATPVQGEEAVYGVVAALQRLNGYHAERAPLGCIVVARGGGSPEELAVFNDEAIARAIFASQVPVVSAIGHEVDWTIADLVADVRAPTPSAAAEMVAPDVADLRRQVQHGADRLRLAARRRIADARTQVENGGTRLARRSPGAVIAGARGRTDDLAGRAMRSIRGTLATAGSSVETCRLRLAALSPTAILDRGYAVCTRPENGSLLTDAAGVAAGERVAIRLARGGLLTDVVEVKADPGRPDGHTNGSG
jgi:exodeoxyribonuclease VII large subunit